MSIYTWVTGRNQLSQVKGTLSLPCFFPSANISVQYQHWSIPSPYLHWFPSFCTSLICELHYSSMVCVKKKMLLRSVVIHCGLSSTLDVNNCQFDDNRTGVFTCTCIRVYLFITSLHDHNITLCKMSFSYWPLLTSMQRGTQIYHPTLHIHTHFVSLGWSPPPKL